MDELLRGNSALLPALGSILAIILIKLVERFRPRTVEEVDTSRISLTKTYSELVSNMREELQRLTDRVKKLEDTQSTLEIKIGNQDDLIENQKETISNQKYIIKKQEEKIIQDREIFNRFGILIKKLGNTLESKIYTESYKDCPVANEIYLIIQEARIILDTLEE